MDEAHPVIQLLQWIDSFEFSLKVRSVEDISDGIILSMVLHSICAQHFSTLWLEQFHSGMNLDWEKKHRNLEIVFESCRSFLSVFSDESNLLLPTPNLVAIARFNDNDEAFCLLQLILACAVNCETKSVFVERIMQMEESVQNVLMQAIQQLMPISSTSKVADKTQLDYQKLISENLLLLANCKNLELQCSNLLKERNALRLSIANTCRENHSNFGSSEEPMVMTPLDLLSTSTSTSSALATVRISQLQDQVTKLREELDRTEIVKDELNAKLAESVETIQTLKQKCDILSKQVSESAHLKDELDIVREELATISHLPHTVDHLKKRAGDASELRFRCANLEAENKLCIDRINELERELRLSTHSRSQVATQAKSQDVDLETACTLESLKSQLLITNEKLAETKMLKTHVAQKLSCLQSIWSQILSMEVSPSIEVEAFPDNTTAYSTVRIRSKVRSLVDELANIHDLLISSSSDKLPLPQSSSLSSSQSTFNRNIFPVDIRSESSDFRQLSSSILVDPTQRYRAYLWKARNVFQSLQKDVRRHQSANIHCPDLHNRKHSPLDEVVGLRKLLTDKDVVIENLEHNCEQTRLQRDAELRILLSAWYNIGLNHSRTSCFPKSVSNRSNDETNVDATNVRFEHSSGISFLEGQRMLHL